VENILSFLFWKREKNISYPEIFVCFVISGIVCFVLPGIVLYKLVFVGFVLYTSITTCFHLYCLVPSCFDLFQLFTTLFLIHQFENYKNEKISIFARCYIAKKSIFLLADSISPIEK
jgi:hypothetical protein